MGILTDRVQLNLRLDGRRDLLETIKEVAASEGLSVNAWVIRTLEAAANSPAPAPITNSETIPAIPDIEPILDTLLDTRLDTLLAAKFAAKFAGIEQRLGERMEERLGKLRA